MLDTDRSEQIMDGEVLGADAPGCVALVPVTQTVHWARKSAMAQPDPTFLAHLMAAADQAPQTRDMRGSIAQTAYGAYPRERRSVARRTRQVV
jgi:hypothetical protein